MSAKLSAANPYLRDRDVRDRTIMESVTTSSAIEGIRTLFKRRQKIDPSRPAAKRKRS